MMMDARSIAQALGGIVQNGAALVPGPGHKPHDRSLKVYPDPNADNGFRTHSFAGDDPLHCRDYVAQKLGLPAWQPRRSHPNGHPPGVAMHRGSCFWSAARCVEIRQLGILRIAIEVALSRVVCSQLFLS